MTDAYRAFLEAKAAMATPTLFDMIEDESA